MFSVPPATTTRRRRRGDARPARRRTRRRVASRSSMSTRSTFAFGRSSRCPPRELRGCRCSASTCRRSSGSPAGTSRSACSSRPCTSAPARAPCRARGSRARPCRRSSASPCARARRAAPRPGRSTGREVRLGERRTSLVRQAARRVPLLEIAGVRAQRDLRVDGRAAADAPAGDQRDDSPRRR